MLQLVPRDVNGTVSNCAANCSVAGVAGHYYWAKQQITATLTAATVIYIVDKKKGTTRTETKYNELPAGVTPPPTNAAGTQTTSITVYPQYGVSSIMELYAHWDFTIDSADLS